MHGFVYAVIGENYHDLELCNKFKYAYFVAPQKRKKRIRKKKEKMLKKYFLFFCVISELLAFSYKQT